MRRVDVVNRVAADALRRSLVIWLHRNATDSQCLSLFPIMGFVWYLRKSANSDTIQL